MRSPRILRVTAAVALLIGGLVHLDLYFGGYRSTPDANLGRSFLLNAIASAVVAAAVAVRKEWFIRLGGIGVAAGTLVAFAASRQGSGILGLREQGLEPSPQAAIALIVEIAAIVLLALTFVPKLASSDESSGRTGLIASLSLAAVATIGFAAFSANNTDEVDAPGGQAAPGAVSIKDFAFGPDPIEVAKGTTVTWTNNDAFAHSVIADDKSFGSDKLATGDSFEHQFDATGTFTYACGIHPSMTQSVVVNG